MKVHIPDSAAVYMPAVKVFERYSISTMTLWRWLSDEALNFPRPVYLGRFRYFKVAELESWERAQPKGRTRASATAAA